MDEKYHEDLVEKIKASTNDLSFSSKADSNLPATQKKDYFVIFKKKISKKVVYWAGSVTLILILLLFGMIQQGIIGDWGKKFKKATATLTVIDEKNSPIDNAQVFIDDQSGSTDNEGLAKIEGLYAGAFEMRISKTGYITLSQNVSLKKGDNQLGTFTLKEKPVARVDITLTLLDYIHQQPITEATVTIGDIKGIFSANEWLLNDVPIGTHILKITKNGYNTYSNEIEITKDTKKLDDIELVVSGKVVFESNRDKGKRGLYVANYDGSEQKPLIGRIGEYEDFTPNLSPDQTKVAFTSTRDGEMNAERNMLKQALYLVNIDGSGLVKLGSNDWSSAVDALWSSSSAHLCFTNGDESTQTTYLKIYHIKDKKTYSYEGLKDMSRCHYAKNNSLVFFTARKNDGSGGTGLYQSTINATDLKVIDEQTSYLTIIEVISNLIKYYYYDNAVKTSKYFQYNIDTGEKSAISAPLYEYEQQMVVVSPDGKYKAYASSRDGKSNLYISDPDGKKEKQLTQLNSVSGGGILWSKNSDFIIFNNFKRNDETARYLVSINGTAKPRKIVDIYLGTYEPY